MTTAEIVQFLGELRYDQDDRNAPDNHRRGQFKAGWEDWTVRRETYADDTLQRLTWHNLGYRFGRRFGPVPTAEIQQAYELLAAVYGTTEAEGVVSLPGEAEHDTLVEGATCRVIVNAYERNPEARRRCIARYGTDCYVCGINLGQAYGLVAEGFIHVHHLRPLSEIGAEYVVDPERDLRPVCPNCHAVFHRRTPAFSLDEMRELLRNREVSSNSALQRSGARDARPGR
jgi:hypothetical protein